jgi:hypothetical protein
MLNFVNQNECWIIETACTIHVVSLTPLAKYDTTCTIGEQFLGPWQPFKENIYQNHICMRLGGLPSTTKYNFLNRLYLTKTSRIDTACAIIGDFIVEFLREYEAELKKALVRESGAERRFFGEKTKGIKFRDTGPLNTRKCIHSAGLYQDTVLFKTFYIAIIWKRRYITS